MTMNKISYEVIEDNGGGLALVVFADNGTVKYIHDGYEYVPADNLRTDIQVLIDGGDTNDWDGCVDPSDVVYSYDDVDGDSTVIYCDTLDQVYEKYTPYDRIGWAIVADQEGIYPERMGGAANKVFCVD